MFPPPSRLGSAGRRRAVQGLGAAGVAALATTAIALPTSHRVPAPARGGATGVAPATLTVTGTPIGPPVPGGFVGLSLEYPAVPAYAGGPRRDSINPVFRRLVAQLAPGRRPVLRVGGDSTDVTWWPLAGMRRPSGITYSLSRRWLVTARSMAIALHARLILGINLKAGRPSLSLGEARAVLDGIGRGHIQALEIGNEPGLYGRFPFYRSAAGRLVYARPRGYGMPAFTREVAALSRRLPGVPLAGPALGVPPPGSVLTRFLAAVPAVRIATLHRYPLNRCFVLPSSPKFPTIAHLLSPFAASGLASSTAGWVAAARRAHVPLRIDELNSVACSGERRVSDSFASALWALDELFAMARAGVTGVNIHTFPGAAYAPFTFGRSGRRWWGTVEPMYYGLLAFARAAPPGSRLLRVRLTGARALSGWATRDHSSRVRITLINKDASRGRAVSVRVAGLDAAAAAPADVVRLAATGGAGARDGVTLGGRGFGARTATGALTGRARHELVVPRGGVYRLWLGPASAALLTLAASGGNG